MDIIRIVTLLAILLPGVVVAATPPVSVLPEANAKPAKRDTFVFSLLPKSLQRKPKLDFNIITEMTAEGRKLPAPTPQKPAYYVSQAGGLYNGGIGGAYNVKPPPPEKLQKMMEKSLAEGGYLPSEGTAQQPTIVIIYHWGSNSFQPPEDMTGEDADGNPVTIASTPEVVLRKALLDRALLLGGAKFAKEVAQAMAQVDQKADLQGRPMVTEAGSTPIGTIGDMLPDPFDQLRARSAEMDRLVDELFSSSFFVVATAYDYTAMAKGQRRALWRTKMTVNSLGVNMIESVPGLIASAAPYFGHETPDPVVITKRISRDGQVEVGTPTVVPDSPAPEKPKPSAGPAEKR